MSFEPVGWVSEVRRVAVFGRPLGLPI